MIIAYVIAGLVGLVGVGVLVSPFIPSLPKQQQPKEDTVTLEEMRRVRNYLVDFGAGVETLKAFDEALLKFVVEGNSNA